MSMWIPRRHLRTRLVKVNPHLIKYIHIPHTHTPCFHFSSWTKHFKNCSKKRAENSLSLSSHIWEIWSSLWRELRFALYVFVGKHTVVETQWHHFKFPRVRRKLQGGKKRADGSKHMPTSNTPTPTGTNKQKSCRCRIPDKAEKSNEMGTKTVTTVTLDFGGPGPSRKKN